ncbi:cystatin-A-like [Rattus rattus]|uniref:cystatin-A-like n=1 Tax=Rattus rattus TaxID=10117 RepID=UPI0013F3529B|nr:cystatin-A-like [Rattus rattus]
MDPGTTGIVGGMSEARPPTPEIQEVADKVKPQLEEKTNEKYEKFEVVEYKSQVVAGQMLLMKVDVGKGCFLHMKVLRDLSGDSKLLDYQTNKTKDDELTDF